MNVATLHDRESVDALEQQVRAAIRPGHDGSGLDEAVVGLRTLARRSRDADPEAYECYQELLHFLHYGDDEPTYPLRQWLASTVYDIEEEQVELPTLTEALPVDVFEARLQQEQERLSPLHHPLFQHLYHGEPEFEQFKVYLRHKWLIMTTFWRSLAEFGDRLQRTDLENTALVYKNVYEELGEGDVMAAHLVQHQRQLKHIGVNVTFHDLPEYPETYEYINYRLMCMRHREPAWGLGSFFSMEATSLEYTMGHYHQLRRFGVEEEFCEIYRGHESIDTEHTSEILQVVRNLVTTAHAQSICLASQRRQMQLWHRHFDRVLEEIGLASR